MTKINWYIFIQIFKSCTLVFFIFTSIAWLLQLSRLFSFMNNLQIDFHKILYLSSYIIPNLMNVTLPFILIFGFVLAFIKLDRDKEIIAIFSLGLSINQILKPLFLVSSLFVLIYLLLNLFLSPHLYEKYKKKEFDLRNIVNLNNINFSNFIKLNDNLIIDFEKEGKRFKNIFINFSNINGDNIIFSKDGIIYNEENKYIFDLNDGYKLNILDQEIEKLEFEKYKIEFPSQNNSLYNNYDINTLTIQNLIKQKEYRSIFDKIIDTVLLLTLIIFFYYYLIKKNNYSFKVISIYLALSILILINHNVIKNIEIDLMNLIFIYLGNLLLVYTFILITSKKNL